MNNINIFMKRQIAKMQSCGNIRAGRIAINQIITTRENNFYCRNFRVEAFLYEQKKKG